MVPDSTIYDLEISQTICEFCTMGSEHQRTAVLG